jgi:chromosome segregation ATPase
MSPDIVGQIFTIGLGIGVLIAGIVTGLNQRKMKGTIAQHVESTSSELSAVRTQLEQKDKKIYEVELEARYNAGRYDASINTVKELQRDVVELKQHEADLVRLLKQAYAQIASMKAAHEVERKGYREQITELQRRIGELEDERDQNRREISRLSEALATAFMEGLKPIASKPRQPMATPAPKPQPSKRRSKAMA